MHWQLADTAKSITENYAEKYQKLKKLKTGLKAFSEGI